MLACHVRQYLTRTDTYLSISVLFIISVSLYISPYPQEDSYPSSLDPLLGMSVIRVVLHNNLILFGSPASTAFRSASRPTTVALTPPTNRPPPLQKRTAHHKHVDMRWKGGYKSGRGPEVSPKLSFIHIICSFSIIAPALPDASPPPFASYALGHVAT